VTNLKFSHSIDLYGHKLCSLRHALFCSGTSRDLVFFVVTEYQINRSVRDSEQLIFLAHISSVVLKSLDCVSVVNYARVKF
jgi:hypothetical protein